MNIKEMDTWFRPVDAIKISIHILPKLSPELSHTNGYGNLQ